MSAAPAPMLRLTLSYALRELRSGVRGFYIFIACLVLGVAMMTAVESLSRGMSDSLRHDGRQILGGDLSIRTPHAPPKDDVLRYFENEMQARVSIITETRAMARSEDAEKATIVEIKAVDNAWPLYGTAAFEDGNGTAVTAPLSALLGEDANGVAGAAVEQSVLPRLGLAIGDKIFVGSTGFEIRAVITREPDRIAGSSFFLSPRLLLGKDAFLKTGMRGAEGLLEFKTHLAIAGLETESDLRTAEAQIEKAFPDESFRIRDFLRAAPRIERYIERLTLFLMLISLTTLLIGGVGISNAVKSFLDSRMAEIATMKCLGAPQSFVFRTYLVQILILATIGVAIGIALGTASAVFASGILTGQFQLTNRTSFYPAVWAIAAAFGYLMTLCFSLWPLGRAVRTAPNELFRSLIAPVGGRPSEKILFALFLCAAAMAVLAVGTATIPKYAAGFVIAALIAFCTFYIASGAVQHALRGVRKIARPELRMAIANVSRPGNPTTSIVLSLGLGLTVLIAMAQVENNFSRLLKDDLAADVPSFFFLDVQPDQKDGFEVLINESKGAKNLVLTPNFRGYVTHVNGIDARKALVDKDEEWLVRGDRGFTWLRDMPAHSTITEGAWWPADYSGDPLISVASNVKRAFDIGVGDKITVNILGVDITATIANVRDVEWASFTMNFAITFAPGTLDDFPAPYIATAIVDTDAEEKLQAGIARAFPNITSVRVKEALEIAQGLVRAVAEAVRISAVLTLVAGTLVLAGGIAAARRRHIYDAVVLKVLGATRRRILGTFLLEYGLMGMITVGISAVLGTLGGWAALETVLNIPFAFSWKAVIYVTILCLGITLLAGLSGTLRALGQKPARWLRNP